MLGRNPHLLSVVSFMLATLHARWVAGSRSSWISTLSTVSGCPRSFPAKALVELFRCDVNKSTRIIFTGSKPLAAIKLYAEKRLPSISHMFLLYVIASYKLDIALEKSAEIAENGSFR